MDSSLFTRPLAWPHSQLYRSPAGAAEAPAQLLPAAASRLGGRALCSGQTRHHRLHLRDRIGVVVHDLPTVGFSAKDVRDAAFEAQPLACQRELGVLDAHRVGEIPD